MAGYRIESKIKSSTGAEGLSKIGLSNYTAGNKYTTLFFKYSKKQHLSGILP
jgi:hypothetical protein